MNDDDYTLKRTIRRERGYDLVVAGGGPGGCGAALAAARLGAKVLLLEGSGCLGGMGTSALVAAFVIYPVVGLLDRVGVSLGGWRNDVVPMIVIFTYMASTIAGNRRYR